MKEPHPAQSGDDEAVILVKAAPTVGAVRGETVCCAGISRYNEWVRLYPVAFRTLEDSQKFGRWDVIKYRWRKPRDDDRSESRRVDQGTIEIAGCLPPRERQSFLSPMVRTSLIKERENGKSFALIEPEILDFVAEKKTAEQLSKEQELHDAYHSQTDLLVPKQSVPYQPCPYNFRYVYRIEDGEREGTCQDWEMEATYFRRRKDLGETAALESMKETFGHDYPRKGMLLAMGTHSRWRDTWLINGVIRVDKIKQASLL